MKRKKNENIDQRRKKQRKLNKEKKKRKKILVDNCIVLKGEKWVKHYSCYHKILLVGEGDFSFSLTLALGFGSAFNICATSLDSYETLFEKYGKVGANLKELWRLGATLLHGVDATQMKHYPQFMCKKFDRIVYNFPHAGFHGKEDNPRLIKMHKDLVRGFFSNARWLLQLGGEVHVSHKTFAPYSDWNIKELAHESGLQFLECVPFDIGDYPHYENKRGQGLSSDQPFKLGKCSTFKFIASPHSTNTVNSFPNHMVSRDLMIYETILNKFRREPPNPKEICSSNSWYLKELQTLSQTPFSQLKFIVKGLVGLYPGVARYTGALLDSKNRVIAAIFGPLFEFHSDSNFAELAAIKHALLIFERLNLFGKASLVVETDSTDAVSWIKSHYGNPWEVKPIVREITMALGRIRDADICCSFGQRGAETDHQVVRGLEMMRFGLNRALELWF